MATLFTLALPGISVGQCPTSFSGKMDNDIGTASCGFRSIDVRILTSDNFDVYLGTVSVVFSSNVRIESVTPVDTRISVSGLGQYYFGLTIVDDFPIVTNWTKLASVKYTLLSGTTGTAETTLSGMLAVNGGGYSNCGTGGNEAAYNLGMQRRTLTGNLLIPSEFSCTQGTNHGLPDRDISIAMNYSPYWEICDINDTPNDGEYECEDLRNNCEYQVCVSKSDDEICGIGENDIARIQNFILNADCFDHTWQLLAADANNNGVITSQDITQLMKVLLSETPDIPLPWKYVSISELNALYLINNNDDCTAYVPIVDNCDEIILAGNPEVEDWYGFPAGDVDYSCTDCALTSGPVVRTNQTQFEPVMIQYTNTSNQLINFQFTAPEPAVVWSLSLQLDHNIQTVNDFWLDKNKEDLFDWNFDNNTKLLKMVYVSMTLQSPSEFKFHLKYSGTTSQNFPTVNINLEDPRINNVLIDRNKNHLKFELESNLTKDERFAFYLPDQRAIRVINSSSNYDHISLFDLTGKCILSFKNSNQFIPVDHILPGVYILQKKSDYEERTMKLIIH